MRQVPYQLRQILEAAIESLGYELVGVEFHAHAKNALLRVYIDQESGITVDDCQQASHQISGVLDVEDPIPGHYTLEVSSPGLDRPLFEAKHFIRFAGHKARIQLSVSLNGRKRFIGLLHGLRGNDVVLKSEDQELLLPLDQIEKARLIPEF